DISQFYPSIYTHSLPWAILGKEKAKKFYYIKSTQSTHWSTLLRTNADAKLYSVCDHLDTLIRNCNEKQSVGLPIGPDTSFILAECITARIDKEIKNKLTNVVHEGVRYFDDYYFYVNSRDD